MEAVVGLCPRPNLLLLSSSSHQHCPPVSLLRDSLGRTHSRLLRGFRCRRRCRKPGILRSWTLPRCAAAMDPLNADSLVIVAAAVAAFSVLQVLYLDRIRRRDREAELQGNNSEMENGVRKYCSEDLRGNHKEIFGTETKDLALSTIGETFSERENASGVKDVADSDFERNDSTHVSTPALHMSHSKLPSFEVLPLISENVEKETTGNMTFSCFAEMVASTCTIEPDIIKELLLGNYNESLKVSTLPEVVIHPSSNGFATPVNNMFTQAIKDDQLVHTTAVGSKVQVASAIGICKEPVREASTFNEETQLGLHHTFDFRCLCQIPRKFSLQDNVDTRSQINSSPQSSKISMKASLLAADSSKELVTFASSKEAFIPRRKDLSNLKSAHGDVGGKQMHQNKNKRMSRNFQPNGNINEDATGISLHISRYNRLLREARLSECVDLLENVEKMGILDMDKVYHTRFLKACKMHKSVNEAFRFTKLIKKPTLSTFNMLLSVCASSQDYEGALQVLLLVKDAGLRPDCQLYTTLISTCGKSGKVDAMFEVFHEMVNAGVEPNLHTYGALIDGCARAGQVAKAFGAYGILRSKNVKPDRVIFNALITACGQSGAMDRAFDVLAEMRAEPQPIDPDHVTVGALIKTCTQAGRADRAREVYQMLHQYKIKGTPDVYTIAVNSCSLHGDLEFALSVYDDMQGNGILPDEMFLSTIIDVAGHAGNVDIAFDILHDARIRGLQLGTVSYSSLMGACSKAKKWQKALELYEEIKAIKLHPTVSTLNALITALCDGDQLLKAVEVLNEMKEAGVYPNIITYSLLFVACEKKDEIELGFELFSQAKKDAILLNLIMCRCLTGLCLQRYEKACLLGEHVLSFNSGRPQTDNKWTKWAIMVYRQTIAAGVIPSSEVFSQVLGCLKFPNDISLRKRLVENLGVSLDNPRNSNFSSLLDGFGEYDPRAFSILEEASSMGVVSCISFTDNPVIVDARNLQIHTAEVYLLTVLKGLKHRLAAGARLPNITILLPIEKTCIFFNTGEKNINLSARVGQTVAALLRRLGLPYQGDESYGRVRINGLALRRWFKPKISFPSFGGKSADISSLQTRLAKEITNQQRNIRSTNNLYLE